VREPEYLNIINILKPMFVHRTKLQRARFIVLKFMTISLEEEQHGEDEMQDVDANVNTLDEEAGPLAIVEMQKILQRSI
jgi:hypothetical protein